MRTSEKAINVLADEIAKAIEKICPSLPFNRTVDGVIIKKTSIGYLVSFEGSERNVSTIGNGEYQQNDRVKVHIPMNNKQNAYIDLNEKKVQKEEDYTPIILNKLESQVNTALSHSTEPILIGTWMGKPLYRRCFVVGSTRIGAESWATLATLNKNLNVIKLDGARTNADNTTSYPLMYYTNRVVYDKDTGNIRFYNPSSSAQTFYSFNIIIEYTM